MVNTRLKRLSCLDNLEILSAVGYEADFPVHFHDQVCVTLTCDGFECTEVEGQQLISPKGYISLTHEEEAHANPNLNGHSYSFITYYISPDLLRSLNNNRQLRFRDRVIFDPVIYHHLIDLANREDPLTTAGEVSRILQRLVNQYHLPNSHPIEKGISGLQMKKVLAYMEHHLEEKISLDQLAKICGQSKFQFLRAFKKSKGITPATYLVIKRIEKAKTLLRKGNSIVGVSLSCGFFDQSHFHKYFRKYVGMTPAQYLQACNILQD